jgi:hypothetical protein
MRKFVVAMALTAFAGISLNARRITHLKSHSSFRSRRADRPTVPRAFWPSACERHSELSLSKTSAVPGTALRSGASPRGA